MLQAQVQALPCSTHTHRDPRCQGLFLTHCVIIASRLLAGPGYIQLWPHPPNTARRRAVVFGVRGARVHLRLLTPHSGEVQAQVSNDVLGSKSIPVPVPVPARWTWRDGNRNKSSHRSTRKCVRESRDTPKRRSGLRF